MIKPQDKIAIIIVNYNTPLETKECLQSLTKLVHPNFEYQIIVVDNGSKTEFSVSKKLNSAGLIKILRTEANIGFTGGNNLGITEAIKDFNPDYFLLLNSDTTVKSDFLAQLHQTLADRPAAGLAASKIYFYPGCEYFHDNYSTADQGRVIWYAGGTIDWRNLLIFHRGVDELDRGQFDQVTTTDFTTGCCLLIKRQVIEEVGILDKRYFLYLEDVDWSIRAQKKGWTSIYCPTAVIWHKNASSSQGAGSEIHQYYQARNRLFFFTKYGNLGQKRLVLKLVSQFLVRGSRFERQAVKSWLLRQMGKQPVI